jgi:hypothetical protein
MNDSTTDRRAFDQSRKRSWPALLWIVVGAGAIAGVAYSLARGSETSTYEIVLDGRPVMVTKTWHYWHCVSADHRGLSIGRTDGTYKTKLDFSRGPAVTITTAAEPLAIWSLAGNLYVAGCTWRLAGWLTAKIEKDGRLTVISRKDLPAGQRDWNLVAPQDRPGMEDMYREWAP